MAGEEDEFAAFLADIEQATPVTDEVAAPGPAEPAVGEKREREESTTVGPSVPPSVSSEAPPVLKKAKVVVARAKPQLVTEAPPQPAAVPQSQPGEPSGPHDMGPSGPGPRGSNGGLAGGPASAPFFPGGGQGSAMMAGPSMAMAGPSGMMFAPEGIHGFSSQQSAYQYVDQPDYQQRKNKKFVRVGAGDVWEDSTLNEWPEGDFRLFCGDLGNEVTDAMLAEPFRKYTSFARAKVIREKQIMRDGKARPGGGKTKGYGFVSFLDPFDGLKAMREMNGKYIGSRPVKIRKSEWQERNINEAKKKEKNKKKFLASLGIV